MLKHPINAVRAVAHAAGERGDAEIVADIEVELAIVVGKVGVDAENAYLERTLYWVGVYRKTLELHPKRRAS